MVQGLQLRKEEKIETVINADREAAKGFWADVPYESDKESQAIAPNKSDLQGVMKEIESYKRDLHCEPIYCKIA